MDNTEIEQTTEAQIVHDMTPYQPKYKTDAATDERNANNFTYHAPFGDQVERYGVIRYQGLCSAQIMQNNCPPSRELSLALTKIEEAIFWANAAIARNEKQGAA